MIVKPRLRISKEIRMISSFVRAKSSSTLLSMEFRLKNRELIEWLLIQKDTIESKRVYSEESALIKSLTPTGFAGSSFNKMESGFVN